MQQEYIYLFPDIPLLRYSVIPVMLFPSFPFLFWFLPLTAGGYYVLPARYRIAVLLVASYIFYAWWDPRFCLLMLFSTCIDYIAGREIAASASQSRRRGFLLLSIATNLALLGFFKYYMLFSGTLSSLFGQGVLPAWQILLPVGISFYTFQSMSYSIDIYRGDAKPTRGFLDFACYVSLFPQLVAGPIVRYSELAEQLRERTHTWDKVAEGLYRFVLGLSKKVIIADACAVVADAAFGADALTGADAWLGMLAYAFQIYFDFSGYSDMAIGLGLLFGFRFPENFKTPYHSASIGEFWRRWHMTLSRWIRDYLYIPLGGSRGGTLFTLRNLVITMFLAGLWHGAAWTFALWGLYYGVLLVGERMIGRRFDVVPKPIRRKVTFLLVLLGWVLFRASSFEHAAAYYRSLVSIDGLSTVSLLSLGIVCAGALCVLFEPYVPKRLQSYSVPVAVGFCCLLVMNLVVIAGNTASPFIYFQF